MSKSPAYQYYPDHFEQGTATFTLTEVGAYQRLLNYQWAHGSIPGDSIKSLALILRCTPNVAKSVWNTIVCKFERGEDGLWRNARMEHEREKQAKYREKQSERGKASAAVRWHSGHNTGGNASITTVITPVTPSQLPQGNSTFTSTSTKPPTAAVRVATPAAGAWPNRRRPLNAAFEHPRFYVPNAWHDARIDGLANGEFTLKEFYDWLAQWVDAHPQEDTEPRLKWLTDHFNAWMESRKKAPPTASAVDDVAATRAKIAAMMRRKPESVA